MKTNVLRQAVLWIFSILVISCSGLITTVVSRDRTELSASIEMLQEEHDADDPIHLRFSLTNRTDHPLTVLTWNTPLEGVHSDMFDVEKDGEQIPYINKQVKRGDTAAEHHVTIPAGGETARSVEMGKILSCVIFES